MTVKNFVSPNAPSFKIRLCGEPVVFINGCKSFDLNNEEEAAQCAELEKCMKRSPQLTQHVQLVDREAAEKAAIAHRKKMEEMGGAVPGRVSSADMGRLAASALLAQRDEQLQREGNTPEEIAALNAELKEADLSLTEKSSEVVKNQEGFIPEEKVVTPDLEKEIDLPKQLESPINPLAAALGNNKDA